jgi:hypothetical protein
MELISIFIVIMLSGLSYDDSSDKKQNIGAFPYPKPPSWLRTPFHISQRHISLLKFTATAGISSRRR